MRGNPSGIQQIYDELYRSISEGTISLYDLTKSEVLSDSIANYKKKQLATGARRSAAYEVAIAENLNLKSGDIVRYYVTGEKKKVTVADNSRLYNGENVPRDENRAYYCTKLDELAENFRAFENGSTQNDL